MSKKYIRRNISIALLCAALAGSMVLSGCGTSESAESSSEKNVSTVSESSDTKSEAASANEKTASSVDFDKEDTDTSYDENGSVSITLNGNSASVSGDGAKADGSTVTISKAGTYVISGKLDDGNIVIAADKNDTVKLVLNNAEINSKTTSAIYSSKADKTIILLQDGTVNTISDGSDYVTKSDTSSESSDSDTDTSDDSDAPNAAIFIQDDLTILGNGTLNVTGNANNGITSKDTLRISSGTINVTASHHGITGKDNLAIEGGKITVTAESGDGLRSTYSKTDDKDKGNVFIENTEINVTAGNDGIQAEYDLTVNSGTITIVTGGGAAANKTSNNGGGFGFNNSSSSDDTESMKGIKAGDNLTINGGTISVDSYDDSIHSNGDASITGGTINLKSGDDGIHSDNTLTVKDGMITVEQSYEGLEGNIINISGGTTDITASDDGVNCSGGNDASGFGGMDGNMQFGRGGMRGMSQNTADSTNVTLTAATEDSASESKTAEIPELNISGGTLYVNAQGDGLDSNGNVEMSGGTVVVNGTTSGGNGILDHNGTFNLTGGTLIGAGTSDMLEMPSDSSSQKTIAVLFEQNQTAGSSVYLTDSDGKVIAAMSPEKNYSCLLFSSSALESGKTYKVYSGGKITGDSVHGYYSQAVVSDGTEYCSFALSENAVTYVNASGVTTYSGMGGGMGGRMGMGRQNVDDQQTPQMPDNQNGDNQQTPQMPDNQNGNDQQTPQMPENRTGGRGGRMQDRENASSGDNAEKAASAAESV